MNTDALIDHDWFDEHTQAYLAGGLDDSQRAALESHAATCATCGLALAEAREADVRMTGLFADVRPPADLEERIVNSLRHPLRGPLVHPMVRRAAAGVAAVLVLGAIGYVGGTSLKRGEFSLETRRFSAAQSLERVLPRGPAAGRYSTEGGVMPAERNPNEMAKEANDRLSQDMVARSATAPMFIIGSPALRTDDKKEQLRSGMVSRNPEMTLAERMALSLEGGVDPHGVRNFVWRPSDIQVYDNSNSSSTRDIVLNASGATIAASNGQSFTAGGVVSGNGGLTVGSAGNTGTLLLTNAGNTFGGNIAVNGGTLAVTRNGAMGATNNASVNNLDGSSLLFTGSGSSARSITMSRENADNTYVWDNGAAMGAANGQSFKLTGTINYAASGSSSGVANFGTTDLAGEGGYGFERDATVVGGTTNTATFGVNGGTNGGRIALNSNEIVPPVSVQYAAGAYDHGVGVPTTQASTPATAPSPTAPAPQTPPLATGLKIIRNGDMEFEVDQFDSACDRINKITMEEGGAVASANSEKLPNGKMRGLLVIRVLPDNLDRLIYKLRGIGDLQSQHIGSSDVTKDYTDVAGRLRAARAMEERLLDMIHNTKGNVKDLLAAEKELANWRGVIEQYEGNLHYYDNLIALSTLNITLSEKNLAVAGSAVDSETISMGVQTPDVPSARSAALSAIEEVKGRVIASQLRQYDAGQYAATIVAEVPPESAGPLTDRLHQLGSVSRLDVERKQTTKDNSAVPALAALRVDRQPTRLELSLFNLANVAPRQTQVVSLACADVESAYRTILGAADLPSSTQPGATGSSAGLAAVRVVSSTMDTQNPQQTTAVINLEARADQAALVEKIVRGAGEIMKLSVAENADTANVTRTKQGFSITLIPMAQVAPRESRNLQVAVRGVSSVYDRLLAFLQATPAGASNARVLAAQLSGDTSAAVGATLSFEIPRVREIGLEATLAGQKDSDVLTRSVSRASGDTDTIDSKIRYDVTLIDAAKVLPRQTTTLAIEVSDVQAALNSATQTAASFGGSTLDPRWARDESGASSASVSINIPIASAAAAQDALERLGNVRVVQSVQAPQVPDGTLARARFELTLGNAQQLVEPGGGLGDHFRDAMRTSLSGLLWSFQWIVIGLLLVGPWVLLAWIARKLWRRSRRKVTGM